MTGHLRRMIGDQTMTSLFSVETTARLAEDFIPRSHRHLPVVRLFLPMRDALDHPVRWSEVGILGDDDRSRGWTDFLERVENSNRLTQELQSSLGFLDPETAATFSELLGSVSLTALHWVGYSEMQKSDAPLVKLFGEYFLDSNLNASDLRPGDRVPAFVWDDRQSFAWGSRLYPDSLVVAARPHIIKALHADPRVDVVSLRGEDAIPISTGD